MREGGRAGKRAGCGLAERGPTRETRGERRSRRPWSRRPGTEQTDTGRGWRDSRLLAAGRRRRPGGGCWVIRPCRLPGRGRFASVPPAAVGPNPGPRGAALTGPRQSPAALIPSCSACRFQALVAKFCTARPNSDGQALVISWPPPATRPPLVGWLPSGRLPLHCPALGV